MCFSAFDQHIKGLRRKSRKWLIAVGQSHVHGRLGGTPGLLTSGALQKPLQHGRAGSHAEVRDG